MAEQADIPLGFLSSSMYKEAIIMGLMSACAAFFSVIMDYLKPVEAKLWVYRILPESR